MSLYEETKFVGQSSKDPLVAYREVLYNID